MLFRIYMGFRIVKSNTTAHKRSSRNESEILLEKEPGGNKSGLYLDTTLYQSITSARFTFGADPEISEGGCYKSIQLHV